jgi:hypothetical protein
MDLKQARTRFAVIMWVGFIGCVGAAIFSKTGLHAAPQAIFGIGLAIVTFIALLSWWSLSGERKESQPQEANPLQGGQDEQPPAE